MKSITNLFFLNFLIVFTSDGQTINRLTGPLAAYHIAAGYCYKDSLGIDSLLLQKQFKFGELAIPNQSFDNNHFTFQAEIDSSLRWHANKVLAIIQPPSEHGIYNQPSDTLMLSPFPIANYPGMIQGAKRFSDLSQQYSGVCGVILDDWNGDTAMTHQLYDAIKGKPMDADGHVESGLFATTPKNKLYCVVYNTDSRSEGLPYMDGIYYSFFQWQNCCYANLDADIDKLRINYPHKEIMIAIFLKNSFLGWTNPESIHYMLSHALDRYDDGDINQVNLFAGSFLTKDNISLAQWNAIALPYWLDSLYYPYLGQGQGKVVDCNSGNMLDGVKINVYCKGRVSGDTLSRSAQRTDGGGAYQFGLWAGNRDTDSSYYWLEAEKSGYITSTNGFWIKRGDTTTIPTISLCSGINGSPNKILVFPNPNNGRFTIEVPAGLEEGTELSIYNVLGEKIFSNLLVGVYSPINLSNNADGMYIAIIKQRGRVIASTRFQLIQ